MWKLLFTFAKGTGQNEERALLDFIEKAQDGLKTISADDNQWFMEGKLYLHYHKTHITFETDVHGVNYTEVQEEPKVLRAIQDWPQLLPGTFVEQEGPEDEDDNEPEEEQEPDQLMDSIPEDERRQVDEHNKEEGGEGWYSRG